MAYRTNSLAHTKWLCKYHIVIVPKYRRKIIYYEYRKDLQDIIRTLCRYKQVEIIEGHMMPDHVHLLLSIPPRISISSFMGYLKGISALMIGVFRRGNKPVVVPGEGKRAEQQRKGELEASPKRIEKIKPPDIMVVVWRPYYQNTRRNNYERK